ncbi:MAG TPA: HAMP domain-containing sensor histidine kinase [Sphingobium sp.]|uniref:sensor histidine kinase n=1 Tax=Sphingobium sp. TaxID=1912891 RepID=UPI002ECFEF1C
MSTLSYASKRIRAGNDYADVVIYRDGSNLYGIQDQGARSIAISLCVFVASILAASQLVGMLLLFLMMRGVRRATREAAMIGPDNLDQRISMGDVPEDIRGLVAATNAALDRVEEGYRLQGRFAGAVAHELRTPIAVLRLKCEALPISPQRDGLIGMVDRLTHILGQLMALALLEGATPNLETADLVEVVREITINLVEEVHISGRTLEFSAPVLAVPGRVDVHYMTTILGNLVGNAIAHTRPGSHIVVGIHESGIVYVVDDGPGMILAPSLATAQPRYRRADGKRTGGLGLGLRIVARSVELMGGELDIVTGGPGCQIRITLPQA